MKLLGLTAFGIVLATASSAYAAPLEYVAFDTGGEHACYTTNCDLTQCWGGPNNTFGEAVDRVGRAIDVAVGTDHTCTLDAKGFATCWGRDEALMQLLDAPNVQFSDIEAGDFHTCGIRRSDRGIECWGWQKDETNTIDGVRPNTAYRQLDAGYDYTCAVTSGQNAIDCWGAGVPGRVVRILSWDLLANHHNPIVTPERFAKVSVGLGHFCFVTTYGDVYCLGDNKAAQLSPWSTPVEWVFLEEFGDHSELEAGAVLAPVVHEQIGDYVDVGATLIGTCALESNGDNVCWGYPFEYGWGDELPFSIEIEELVTSANNYCGWNKTTDEIECFAESPYSKIDDVEPPLTCP